MSIIISKQQDKYNYVYLITEISTGKKYIGSRGSTIDPIKDVRQYRSSSKNTTFIKNQQNNPLDYKYDILSLHDTRHDALIEEARLHKLYNVKCDCNYYNASNQTSNGFTTTGRVTVKDSSSKTFSVSLNDPRYLSDELVVTATGRVTVMDSSGKTFSVNSDDPRYLSGELKHPNTGKVVITNIKTGNTYHVEVDDPRCSSSEFIYNGTGRVTVMDSSGKTFSVYFNDPRYLSGELKHPNTGKVVVSNKLTGEVSQVKLDDEGYIHGDLVALSKGRINTIDEFGVSHHITKDDPRYVSGELKPFAVGKIPVKDEHGVTYHVSHDDPQYLSGELKHVTTGKTSVKDRYGNYYKIDSNDPRIKSGELIGTTGKWYVIDDEVYSQLEVSNKFNISHGILNRRCKSQDTQWAKWRVRM